MRNVKVKSKYEVWYAEFMSHFTMAKIEKYGDIAGWFGIILIQSSTLPTSFGIINGTVGRMPPLDMTIMVWGGLLLFLIRSIIRKDVLYITSNAIGFFLQTLMLILIVFK